MPDDDVTLGEVARRLDRLADAVDGMSQQVSELGSRDRADLLRFQQLDARLAAIESTQTWITRLVWAAIIAAILGLVIGIDLPTL